MSSPLLSDVVFNVVFGARGNAPILQALLNALLGLTGVERIQHLEVISPQPDREHAVQKSVVLDVVARDGRDRLFDIEVQLYSEAAFLKRAFYYLSRLAAAELAVGENYEEMPKLIGISILDFVLFKDRSDVSSTYRLYDHVHAHELTDLMELHFLELSKLHSSPESEMGTPLRRWLHVLKFADRYIQNRASLPRELVEEEGVTMALDAMREALAREDVKVMMALGDKRQRDEANRLHSAKRLARKEAALEMIAAGADPAFVKSALHLQDEDLS